MSYTERGTTTEWGKNGQIMGSYAMNASFSEPNSKERTIDGRIDPNRCERVLPFAVMPGDAQNGKTNSIGKEGRESRHAEGV